MLKRAFDISVSATLLIFLSPLIAIIACAIAFDLGRPVLFRQQRPGLDGKPFRIIKFRTMRDARLPDGTMLPDEQRLTGFGRWLRAASLDELPELWNVLLGDMSLVGPRPLLMKYLPLYTREQMRRHDLRPGLTGWAQINGRNAISWDEKFKLDVWYVDNQSMLLDVRILFLTMRSVVNRTGISHADCATMPEFTGASHSPTSSTGEP